MLESLKNLFRRDKAPPQPLPTLDDPLFGPMVYYPGGRVWGAKIRFPERDDSSPEIEILVDADESGPGETQRQFYRAMLERWPQIQTAIGEMLFPPIKKWAKSDYDENNPWGYFDLRGIRVPSLTETPVAWAISYWCPSVKHHFDVQMSDWSPDGLDISRK